MKLLEDEIFLWNYFFSDDTFAQFYYQSRHIASPRPSPPASPARVTRGQDQQPPEVVLGNRIILHFLSKELLSSDKLLVFLTNDMRR